MEERQFLSMIADAIEFAGASDELDCDLTVEFNEEKGILDIYNGDFTVLLWPEDVKMTRRERG